MKDLDAMLKRASSEWHTDVNDAISESEHLALVHLRRRTSTNRAAFGAGLVGSIIFVLAIGAYSSGAGDYPQVQSSPTAIRSTTSANVATNAQPAEKPAQKRDQLTTSGKGSRLVASLKRSSNSNRLDIDTEAGGFDAEYLRITKLITELPTQNHIDLLREHRGVARLCMRWSKFDLAQQHLRLALSAANAIGDPAVVRTVNDELLSVSQ